jgi:hypothetical protein
MNLTIVLKQPSRNRAESWRFSLPPPVVPCPAASSPTPRFSPEPAVSNAARAFLALPSLVKRTRVVEPGAVVSGRLRNKPALRGERSDLSCMREDTPQPEASSLIGVSSIVNSGGPDEKDGRAQALVGSAM